ncbi:hypothetical protein Fmac_017852 [Flemingia macrophylla]|uniref:Uncharacterized protein n=1 Tax=Flemingia macrophylla TaxID=520843 RepID=A0ABD1M3H6_9FABA
MTNHFNQQPTMEEMMVMINGLKDGKDSLLVLDRGLMAQGPRDLQPFSAMIEAEDIPQDYKIPKAVVLALGSQTLSQSLLLGCQHMSLER